MRPLDFYNGPSQGYDMEETNGIQEVKSLHLCEVHKTIGTHVPIHL